MLTDMNHNHTKHLHGVVIHLHGVVISVYGHKTSDHWLTWVFILLAYV